MRIEIEIGRVTHHQALQAPRDLVQRRQTHQLALDLLPFGQWIQQQTSILAIDGGHQTAIRAFEHALAVACWHCQPPFRVQRDFGCSPKHGPPPLSELIPSKWAEAPPYPTFS